MSADYIRTLQDEIEQQKKDKEALIAELNNGGGAEVKKTNASVVKESLVPSVPNYLSNIQDLALCADSESVRLQANKLLVEWAITDKLDIGSLDADEDFKNLLKAIKRKANVK